MLVVKKDDNSVYLIPSVSEEGSNDQQEVQKLVHFLGEMVVSKREYASYYSLGCIQTTFLRQVAYEFSFEESVQVDASVKPILKGYYPSAIDSWLQFSLDVMNSASIQPSVASKNSPSRKSSVAGKKSPRLSDTSDSEILFPNSQRHPRAKRFNGEKHYQSRKRKGSEEKPHQYAPFAPLSKVTMPFVNARTSVVSNSLDSISNLSIEFERDVNEVILEGCEKAYEYQEDIGMKKLNYSGGEVSSKKLLSSSARYTLDESITSKVAVTWPCQSKQDIVAVLYSMKDLFQKSQSSEKIASDDQEALLVQAKTLKASIVHHERKRVLLLTLSDKKTRTSVLEKLSFSANKVRNKFNLHHHSRVTALSIIENLVSCIKKEKVDDKFENIVTQISQGDISEEIVTLLIDWLDGTNLESTDFSFKSPNDHVVDSFEACQENILKGYRLELPQDSLPCCSVEKSTEIVQSIFSLVSSKAPDDDVSRPIQLKRKDGCIDLAMKTQNPFFNKVRTMFTRKFHGNELVYSRQNLHRFMYNDLQLKYCFFEFESESSADIFIGHNKDLLDLKSYPHPEEPGKQIVFFHRGVFQKKQPLHVWNLNRLISILTQQKFVDSDYDSLSTPKQNLYSEGKRLLELVNLQKKQNRSASTRKQNPSGFTEKQSRSASIRKQSRSESMQYTSFKCPYTDSSDSGDDL